MSEQQYRVVADMTSMADDSWITEGDRVTYGSVSSTGELVIFRIERPVPSADEGTVEPRTYESGWNDGHTVGFDDGWGAGAKATRDGLPSPHPPMREQIDEAMVERAARALFEGADGISPGDYSWDDVVHHDGNRAHLWRADARHVLQAALFQNAADQ